MAILYGPAKIMMAMYRVIPLHRVWFFGIDDISINNSDGMTMEAEAAHGTVTRHYRDHQAGKPTSTILSLPFLHGQEVWLSVENWMTTNH
jgi:hypothetical protein